MNRNLLFTLLLTVLSYAVFQPLARAADVTIELVPSTRVILKIISGMTIDDIIERIYPKDADLWLQLREKLIATNPRSFHPDSDLLINGARLKLVDIKRIYTDELVPRIKVGYVTGLQGEASAKDINGKIKSLQINSQIFEGDRIQTEIGSILHLLMDDGAELHLKEDSAVKISEYMITSGYDKHSSSILELLRGGLRKITGAIGASAPANYQVQTGLATIGIRGTEYVIKLCNQDDCSQTVSRNDPGAKLHAVVLDGSISLTRDEAEEILVASGKYGTVTTANLTLEDENLVPTGFLDTEETRKFNISVSQQKQEHGSSNTWKWMVGLLLLAVGL